MPRPQSAAVPHRSTDGAALAPKIPSPDPPTAPKHTLKSTLKSARYLPAQGGPRRTDTLLHDAVEDQGGLAQLAAIRARYGEDVAAIVADCTDAHEDPRPAWRPRKERYIASLARKPARSLAVSLADKTHNAAAINADLRALGNVVWDRFTGGRDGSLWYYRALADAFRAHAPGVAAERFAREVDEMVELAARC